VGRCPPHRQPGYRKKNLLPGAAEGEGKVDMIMGEDFGDSMLEPPTQWVEGGARTEGPAATSDPKAWPADMPTEAVAAAPTVSSKAKKTSESTEKYEYYCNWTVALRQEVFQVEVAVQVWVEAENKYREKLTNADKNELPESQVCMVVAYAAARLLTWVL